MEDFFVFYTIYGLQIGVILNQNVDYVLKPLHAGQVQRRLQHFVPAVWVVSLDQEKLHEHSVSVFSSHM